MATENAFEKTRPVSLQQRINNTAFSVGFKSGKKNTKTPVDARTTNRLLIPLSSEIWYVHERIPP